jgi:hypothetical protein
MIHVVKQICYWELNCYVDYLFYFIFLVTFANLKGQQYQQRIFLKKKIKFCQI